MKNLLEDYDIDGEKAVFGGTVGAGIGAVGYGLDEWYLHWVKQLRTVVINAKTPQEVKEWYDKNITEDDSVIFTRKNALKSDYYSRVLSRMCENNDPKWKVKLLKRLNKMIWVTRLGSAASAVGMGAYGALHASGALDAIGQQQY